MSIPGGRVYWPGSLREKRLYGGTDYKDVFLEPNKFFIKNV